MDPILSDFLKMVNGGDFDEDLDGLKHVQSAINVHIATRVFDKEEENQFTRGARVRFNSRVKPAYLNGVGAIVEKVNTKTCIITIDNDLRARQRAGTEVKAYKSTLSID